MPRKPVPIRPQNPYHISARCVNRERFETALETAWSIMEDYLYLVATMFNLEIHAFVLMCNHYHLLVTAPEGNLSAAMLYFMRETSREISRFSGRINQTYGARNHKTLIVGLQHFMNAYKYVYRNPVRAKICNFVEEYPYSTLHGLCGLKPLLIPVTGDRILFKPNFDQSILNWMNADTNPDEEEEIRRALKRSEFELKTVRETGQPSQLHTKLL